MAEKKKFIGVMFTCCNIYNRIYINKNQTAYIGRCPRCMRTLSVRIGKNGTDNRFFEAN